MLVPIGEWRPDLPALGNPGAMEAKNVQPRESSYAPFRSLQDYSAALGGRCIGYFTARSLAGVTTVFAGTPTKLYSLTGSSLAWVDVTRTSGGDYAADEHWTFNQFGDYVTAWNGVDVPQVFQLGVSTKFAALGGSPSTARYACNARDQVMVGHVAAANQTVSWCGTNSLTTWGYNASLQSDSQELPGGGPIMALVGRLDPHIWCQTSIYTAIFAGPPYFWNFNQVELERGTLFPKSVVGFGTLSFGLCADGLYVFDGAGAKPIAQGKVNKWFFDRFDQGYPDRINAAVDPIAQCIAWAFPGPGHVTGDPNMILFFHWPTGRFAYAEVQLEYLAQGGQTFGFTLEQLDTPMPSIDAGVFSLDSRVWTAQGSPILSAITTAHKLAFFTGATLEATVDTGEAQLVAGRRAFVSKLRPLVDGEDCSISVKAITRNRQQDAVTTGLAVAVNDLGYAPLRSNARYQRARIIVAAGGDWDHIHGIEVDARPAGAR